MSPKNIFFFLFFAITAHHHVSSLNILALFPITGKSHMLAILPVLRGFAEKGHNITSVSYYPLSSPIPNYTDISLKNEAQETVHVFDLNTMTTSNLITKSVGMLRGLYHTGTITCETFYKSAAAKHLLENYKAGDFDVVLVELFNTDCFLPLLNKFEVPIVAVSSSVLLPWFEERFANPAGSAHISNPFATTPSNQMNFLDRVKSTVVHHVFEFVYSVLYNRRDDAIARKYLGDVPSVSQLKYNLSLVLSNTHFTYSNVKASVPQFIEIAGVHVGKPQRLSQDLEKWINGSEHGVIYFSLGSMIKGHTLPEEKRKAFLNAFARLPQRVVWKWENETMPDKPQNVLIKKWMPQSDILAHPNIKAFISHGGLLGTIEAVNYGVPVVVMPQFGDQHTNAKALEKNGGGVILELADVTEETVYNALTTVLDPNFKKQAEELSARFRDRPLPPLETAIYWVEYVARHKGAHHMKTAAVGMPFYKYYLLDVFAFLTAVLAIHLYLAFVPIRFVVRKIRGCKKDAQKTKEKKQ